MWSRGVNVAVAMAPLVAPAAPVSGEVCGQHRGEPAEIVVRMRSGQSAPAASAAVGANVARSVPSRGVHLLRVPALASDAALEHLSRDPRVAWAERNAAHRAPEATTQSFFLRVTSQEYELQYGAALTRVDQAHAHATGAGVVVAVLDTGLDSGHPVFQGRIAPGGFNFVENSADYSDQGAGSLVGHGTLVAGVVVRAAPGVMILPMKVLDGNGVGTTFGVAQAIYAAIDGGACVMNLSLGSNEPSLAINEAVAEAHARGIAVVAAAGNDNQALPAFYPAASAGGIGVAGTDAADVKAAFSDFGVYIAMSAPAVGIVGPFPGNQYAKSDGTSFAAPWVAGGIAVVISCNPAQTPLAAADALRAGAVDIDGLNWGYAGLLGAGRLDVRASLLIDEPAPW